MTRLGDFIRRQKHVHIYWVTLALLILVADYITGPAIQFPILYAFPIGLAVWFSGQKWGWMFAICLPLVRLGFALFLWDDRESLFESAINALIRVGVLSGFVYLVDRVVSAKRELEKEVRILTGILPICSFCKKIRNVDDKWESLEKYFTEHSEAEFSHGICPDCAKKHYPDEFKT